MVPIRPLRSLVLLTAIAALGACGGETGAPADPTGLDPAAKSVCTGDVADIVNEIFPAPGLRNSTLSRCANVQRQYARGEVVAATGMAFDLIDDAIEHAANGNLSAPTNGTLEEALAALIAALLAEIGLEPGAGEVVVGQVDENGGDVTTPSGHAGLEFDPDDVSGPTWVTIVQLPDPAAAGGCPFGFPVPYDCYPLFFDFTLYPEGNLQDPVTAGLCVVDTGPLAPGPAAAARLQLATPDHDNPGSILFWPVATAPADVDCSDLAPVASGWQGELFDAIGPLARLFEVTPAWARPGRLGASISSFSPVAATDPGPGPEPALIAPAAGAVIAQNDPANEGDCTFGNGTWGFRIPFDWTDAVGAASYDLELQFTGAIVPAIQVNVADSDYLHVECTGFVEDANLVGWEWRVRAVDGASMPGPWTASRLLDFSSVDVSQSGTISGQVTDAFGDPIPGATVVIDSTAYAAVADSSGNYEISGIAIPCCTANADGGTGTFSVTASASGYFSNSAVVTITTGVPDGTADIELAVAPVIE